jgi:hypothetical protein
MALPKISVGDLAARLPDEERLRIAKTLVVAALLLCPIAPGEAAIGPIRVELANTMLGAVHALLHTAAECRRAEWWAALQEQQDASAAHGLH